MDGNKRLSSVLALIGFLILPVRTRAQIPQSQGSSGAVEGRVADGQQLALAGAAVEVDDEQGKVVLRVVGLDDGRYRASGVPPGTYSVQFSHSGFQTVKKAGVVVSTGQTTILDVVLPVQQASYSVTVTAPEDDYSVASKTDIPPQGLPVTVDTVPSEIIQQQADTSIVPVINNLPAANAWTQYGSLNYFEFRGFVLDQDPGSAVLLNGLRIEGNRSDSQLNSVESVDVLKGPAAMLYGTQDTGGTINIVEKQPATTSQNELVLNGGSWGTGGIQFGSSGPLGSDKLLYRVDAAYMHSDGFRRAGSNRLNLSPKLFWRIGSRDRIRLNVGYNGDHFKGDAGIPLLPGPDNTYSIPPVNINNRYNSPGNFENLDLPVVQIFYEHDFSDNLRLREAAQYQYISDQYWESEGLAIDTSSVPLQVLRGPDVFSVYFFHRDQAALSQTDLLGNFHFIWRHDFLIGYEFDYLYHKTKRSDDAENTPIPSIDLFNPVETATAITSFPASSYDGLRNLSNAVYFQDLVHIHPKLQILFGGRYDAYRHYDFNYPVVNGVWQYGGPQDIFSQNPFTYRVGVISPILPYFSLYSSWATSFTAQTELSTAGNSLKPESGRQFEVGGRLNLFQNRLSLNADFFHINQYNIAIERTDGVIYQANDEYSQGAEVEFRARASQKLSVFASYGYTQAAFNSFVAPNFDYTTDENLQGFTPPLVPRHTERVWATYDLPKGFVVSVGQRYVSKRATDIYDIFFMPGFSTVDAALTYRRAKMEYSVNVQNVLDNTHYFISAIDDTQIYPGPPINVAATVRYHF